MNDEATLRAADLIYDATKEGPLLRDEAHDLAVEIMAVGYQQAADVVRRLHYVTGAWCFACNRAGAVIHIDGDRDQPSRLCTHGYDNECAADELPWPCPTERALEALVKERTP